MRIYEADIQKTWVMQGVINFTRFFFKKNSNRKFVVGQHHLCIAAELDKVLRGETKRLIINMPPRYGKSELAVKQFIAMGFAVNAKAKFIHLSYSDDLVRDNSKGVQDILRLPEYRQFFPNTAPTTTNSRKWFTESGGGLYAVSSAGQVTGFGAGVVDKENEDTLNEGISEILAAVADESAFGGAIVIDDPIKPDDAQSDLLREKVNQKFETTIRNRVNSRNTPIVVIMQRLHEHDLCGYLQEIEPNDWKVLSLPALYTDERGEEQALWPFKHTVDELHSLREKNALVFDTQYQQNPKPLEGLMYTSFKTYDVLPIAERRDFVRKNYTDTADTGSDWLCSVCYVEYRNAMYITDVLYTKKPMEYTEVALAEMLVRNKVEVTLIESNNGGRGFARNVERNVRLLGDKQMRFKTFTQSENKNVRIFTHSAEVQNLIFYPADWGNIWYEFSRDVKSFRREGRNAHDDAPDVLTSMCEHFGSEMTSMSDENLLNIML